MRDETMRRNGDAPFWHATANEEETHITIHASKAELEALEEKHAERDWLFDLQNPGPCALLISLLLNISTTISWYWLNLAHNTKETQSQLLDRWTCNIFILAPLGILTSLQCLYCFSTLLCTQRHNRTLCITRVVLGSLLGAIAVLVCGFEVGVIGDEEGWVQAGFWAASGVVPGAGVVALLGYVWDCLVLRCGIREQGVEDEKAPLLGKEDV